jgi:hypothetical protein
VGPLQARRKLLSEARRHRACRGALVLVLPALLAGCAAGRAREADRAFTAGVARVERVRAVLVSTRPPRLNIVVEGVLPDACTQLDPPRIHLLGARIEISLETRRPFGARCEPEESPFTRSIPVMLGHEFQLYVVDANGVTDTVAVPPDRDMLP